MTGYHRVPHLGTKSSWASQKRWCPKLQPGSRQARSAKAEAFKPQAEGSEALARTGWPIRLFDVGWQVEHGNRVLQLGSPPGLAALATANLAPIGATVCKAAGPGVGLHGSNVHLQRRTCASTCTCCPSRGLEARRW